jgi:ATP-binding cassette, subfamily C (CFTR/MRP), member 1
VTRLIVYAGQLSEQMTPVVVVAGAVFWTRRGGDDLSVAEVFAVLSIVSLVTAPVSQLLSCLPNAMASVACFDRIQEYLILPDVQDPRLGPFAMISAGPNRLPQGNMPSHAVVIEQGGLVVAGKTQNVLREIDIWLPTSTFTFIIGPVGSGKSTLLKVMLGESILTHGSIQVNQIRMAYCDQTPWLQNVSFRENIIGQVDYDERWYNTVIRACSLSQDFERVANGDMTLIGSGGIALSGGQRHRVV